MVGKNAKLLVLYVFFCFLSCDGRESAKFLVLYVNFLFFYRVTVGKSAKLLVLYVIFCFSHRLPAGPTFHEKSSKIIGAVPRSPCIVLVIPSTSIWSVRSAQKNASIFLQACTVVHVRTHFLTWWRIVGGGCPDLNYVIDDCKFKISKWINQFPIIFVYIHFNQYIF